MYAPAEAWSSPTQSIRRPILCPNVNIGLAERWGSLVGGVALAMAGIGRRSPLGLLMTLGGGYLAYRGYRGHCAIYQAMERATTDEPVIAVHQQCTVQGSREEVYRFWKDFTSYPRWIRYLGEVTPVHSGRLHWTVRLAGGMVFEWDSVVIDDRQNARIAWESTPGGGLRTAGEVWLRDAPGDRGTEVHARLEYCPAGGLLGETAGRLLRPVVSQWLKEDLRRFKRQFETGEIATVEGQTSSRVPARPADLGRYAQLIPAPSTAVPVGVAVDKVIEASVESFPASDSPGWSTTSVSRTVE